VSQYELQGVGKAFVRGSVVINALADVDLTIEQGEFVALEGPSGSGKTTLLQLLGALDRPSSGRVHFEGRDLAALPDGELADLRLRSFGFVFQQFNLIPALTALENVQAKLAPTGIPDDELRARSEAILAEVGLADRATHLPSHLSGGEQQRVAVARALVNEPLVVLADEPTGNLDSHATGDILRLFGELGRAGQTLLVVTHDARVASTADRLLTMRDGAIVAQTRLGAGTSVAGLLASLADLGGER
jgi:putative ABC transport system ATP-binding protein